MRSTLLEVQCVIYPFASMYLRDIDYSRADNWAVIVRNVSVFLLIGTIYSFYEQCIESFFWAIFRDDKASVRLRGLHREE